MWNKDIIIIIIISMSMQGVEKYILSKILLYLWQYSENEVSKGSKISD